MPGEGLAARLLAFGQAPRTEYRAGFCSHVDDWGRLVYDPQYWPWLWDLHVRGEQDRYTFPADHALPDGTVIAAGTTLEREPMEAMLTCLLIKRLAGIHTIVDDLPDGTVYHENPDAPGNWTTSQPDWREGDGYETFLDLVAFHQEFGFTTDVVYCSSFDDVTDGHLRRWVRRALARELDHRTWHTIAWETSGADETWTTRQNWTAGEVIAAELGADALIAVHMDSAPPGRCTIASFLGVRPVGELGPANGRVVRVFVEDGREKNYWIEHDDPSDGDEVGAMRSSPFTVIKTQMPLDGAFSQEFRERQLECWDRYAPPGTVMPALGRGPTGPDWFAGTRRVIFVAFEPGVPFPRFRGWMDDTGVRDVQAYFDGIAVANQGCMWADPVSGSARIRP